MAATEALLTALCRIIGTRNFHSQGTASFFLPGLTVERVGEIGFPLPASQAKELIAVAEAAPYGQGTKTVLDQAVRKCWQIDATQFRIQSAAWKTFLAEALESVCADLGITGKISAHPYKLLVCLITREAFGSGVPDAKEAEGYTGNAGCTMDDWYRRAAIVLWPAGDGERMLCQYDFTGACQTLAAMVSDGRKRPGRRFAALANMPEEAWALCDTALWKALHKTFGIDVFQNLHARMLQDDADSQRHILFPLLAALLARKEAESLAATITAQLAALRPKSPQSYAWNRPPGHSCVGDLTKSRILLSASHFLTSPKDRSAARCFLLADESLDHLRHILIPALLKSKTRRTQPGSLFPELRAEDERLLSKLTAK